MPVRPYDMQLSALVKTNLELGSLIGWSLFNLKTPNSIQKAEETSFFGPGKSAKCQHADKRLPRFVLLH
jgi:hypothetical protein